MSYLGDWSYSIYLYHWPIIQFANQFQITLIVCIAHYRYPVYFGVVQFCIVVEQAIDDDIVALKDIQRYATKTFCSKNNYGIFQCIFNKLIINYLL